MFTLPIGAFRRKVTPIELVESVSGVTSSSALNLNLANTPQDGDYLLWVGVTARSGFPASMNTPSGFSNFTAGGSSGTLDGDAPDFLIQPFSRVASSEAGTGYSLTRGFTGDVLGGSLTVWRKTAQVGASPENWGTGGTSTNTTISLQTVQTGGNARDVVVEAVLVNNGGSAPVGVLTPPSGFTLADGFGYDSTGLSGSVGAYDRFLVVYYANYGDLPSSPPYTPQLGMTDSAQGRTIGLRMAGT